MLPHFIPANSARADANPPVGLRTVVVAVVVVVPAGGFFPPQPAHRAQTASTGTSRRNTDQCIVNDAPVGRQGGAFGQPTARGYDRTMTLASLRRSTAFAAFALLALIAELVGRSATLRVDRALSVVTPLATPTTRYYPFLLAGVKVLGSLTVAALAWRIIRAHAMARAAERLLGTIGHRRLGHRPRPRVRLSARLWFASFAATSLWYLVQNDYERVSQGRWPLLAPWLHTYALPVFAVLAILLAIGWAAVRDFVAEVEGYANATLAGVHRLLPAASPAPHASRTADRGPRRLFGLAFESRPPPLPV
jgi:hypothetical protein